MILEKEEEREEKQSQIRYLEKKKGADVFEQIALNKPQSGSRPNVKLSNRPTISDDRAFDNLENEWALRKEEMLNTRKEMFQGLQERASE